MILFFKLSFFIVGRLPAEALRRDLSGLSMKGDPSFTRNSNSRALENESLLRAPGANKEVVNFSCLL